MLIHYTINIEAYVCVFFLIIIKFHTKIETIKRYLLQIAILASVRQELYIEDGQTTRKMLVKENVSSFISFFFI